MKNKNKTVRCTCAKCNKPMSITVDMYYETGGKVLCRACAREKFLDEIKVIREAETIRRAMVAETRICRDCAEKFDITVGEIEWYLEKGLCPPARCPECRAYRRTKNLKTKKLEV